MIELFEELGETAMINGTRFYLCLSSRHYPHVEIQPCLRRTLEGQDGHQQDIQKYITAKFKPGSSTSKVSVEISTLLLEKAGGVFMWAVLVVDILNKELRDGRAATIKRHIASLPSGLMDLFRHILLRDDVRKGDLLLCLQWILYAKRPLEVGEFYYAMHSGRYQGPDILLPHDPQSITREYMDRFVLSSSKGLAEVTRTKKAIIQFIHESVRDFLLKENGLQYLASDKEANFEAQSHDELRKCCQFYIRVDLSSYAQAYDEKGPTSKAPRKVIRETVLTRFPFLAYATAFMFQHADAAQRFIAQGQFLDELDLGKWLRCDRALEKHEIRRHSFNVNLVYLCAEQGWARLLALALERIPLPAESRQDRYIHPLIAASAQGRRETVQILLERGADVNAQGEQSSKALEAALSSRRQEIVRMLLEKGAKINAQGSFYANALCTASRKGHKEIVSMLLEKGVDVNARIRYLGNALQAASSNGHQEVVHILLENGADINAQRGNLGTALEAASRNGNQEIVCMLLKKGAGVNAQGGGDSNALQNASSGGHHEVVRILLEKGADVNAQGGLWGSALNAASVHGHQEVVRMLLEKGADINAQGSHYSNALQAASSKGHTKIVRVLAGASPDARNM